jgi:predicted nucleic acid-binding protein
MIVCDTDVMIDVLRGHSHAIAWLNTIPGETVALPGFVMMELIQGCRTKAEQAKVQKAFNRYPLLWPSDEACEKALKHFSSHYLSHGIGIIDALIAEVAVEAQSHLCTFNQKHYLPHPTLVTMQPYKR